MTTQSITLTRRTPGQTKQYRRLVDDARERALMEVNPDKDAIQRLIQRGGEFQAYLIDGIRRFSFNPDYTQARSILGDDFVSPEEIEVALGLVYTETQLIELGKRLPDWVTLESLRECGMVLVAGPPTAMNMLDIRSVVHTGLDLDSYEDVENEEFIRSYKVEALSWIAVHKKPIADSYDKPWRDQLTLIAKPMMLPNIAEATWVLKTYKAVRDIYLLDELFIRTSSVDSDGYPIDVGGFDSEGLRVGLCWNLDQDPFLGISASRKF